MSGTAFGTVILHVTPEAALGGPLALLRTGDEIVLDVPARSLSVDVSDDELERRRAEWQPAPTESASGYVWLYREFVQGADQGADLSFLRGSRGSAVPRDSH